jgi:hypothetical protein
MPTSTTTLRALLALLVVAAAVLVVPAPAGAGYVSPAVRRIDQEISHAQAEIARWDRRLARWQVRVSKAAAELQRVMALPAPPPRPPRPEYFTARMVSYRPPPPGTPLGRAHRRLQRVLRDHRAREAQQQAAAWQGFVTELTGERTRALHAAGDSSFAVTSGAPTFQRWATSFLAALGAPACAENVVVVVTWETAESTMARYNPLATTHDMPGATAFNDVGVRDYVSFAQGVVASRDTLEGRSAVLGYDAVLASLHACASATATASAIRDSSWCSGCASGAYVVGLLPEVRASWAEHASRLISTT